MKRDIKIIKGKRKKIKLSAKTTICSYCEETPALPNDDLCQDCRNMINEKSRGFII